MVTVDQVEALLVKENQDLSEENCKEAVATLMVSNIIIV